MELINSEWSEKIKEIISDQKKRDSLILGIALIIVVSYVSFLIIPNFAKLSLASSEVRDLNDRISVVNGRVKRLDQLTKQLELLRGEVVGYTEGLPEKREIPKFLEELSQVAKASNVKILSITPMETKKTEEGDNPYYSVMLVKITAKSGYHQLGGFVSSLENGKRFIEIEDIIIKNDEGFPRRHDVEMVLKTYVSVENEEKTENENKK